VTIEPWFQHETLEAHLYQDEPFVADGTCKNFLTDDLSALGPPTELLSLFSGYLEKLDITDQLRETWFHGLEAVDEDYEIALLLALMTNVEHLEITMPNYKPPCDPNCCWNFQGFSGIIRSSSTCIRYGYALPTMIFTI